MVLRFIHIFPGEEGKMRREPIFLQFDRLLHSSTNLLSFYEVMWSSLIDVRTVYTKT